MARRPSTNGPNGQGDRDQRGRFLVGNRGGPGNPRGGERARLWHRLMDLVTDADVATVYRAMLKAAIHGDTQAQAVFFRVVLGAGTQSEPAFHEAGGDDPLATLNAMNEAARDAMLNEAAARLSRKAVEYVAERTERCLPPASPEAN